VPTLKLTKAEVERIEAPDPSGKQVIYWDAGKRALPGFGVLVSGTTSTKSYIAQRRLPDGRTRRITVGAVSGFKTVEEARIKAGSALAGLRDGKDPKAERQKEAARDRTLRAWVDLYLAARKSLSPRSIEEYQRSVERHLEAWLDRPLRVISPDMVEERHEALGRTAGPAAANSAMRALRAIWNHALDRDGTLGANPVRRLKGDGWFPTPPRTRSVRADQLADFYRAVEALPNRTAADYIKLLLFTGLRRREAAGLRWEEVDFATKVIRLPAARTKAGRKLDLPMASFVRDLLVARRALGNDGGWVFGADSRSGHIEEPKFALDQVAKATGIVVSAHDLRRTFITMAESADVSPLALKSLLNHAPPSGDVTSGYIQITTERLREPAQRVCDRLMQLCETIAPEGVARVGERA
jgi:integrase